MQISDLVGQYHNSAQRPQMTGSTGVSKIVSSLRDMGAGNIFEGTALSVKNGQVVLALSNGQTVNARMDGKVALKVGQSMFFQVKSNEGGTIAIKPYTVAGNSMNITLMDALKAAGLPVDGRNLSMVNAMMEQQMSIDMSSLNQMNRVIMANPEVDVQALVQMSKLGIPATPENASQFQNYMDDQQAIVRALDEFILELPKSLSNGELSANTLQAMGYEMLSVATEGLSEHIMMSENMGDSALQGDNAADSLNQELLSLDRNGVENAISSEKAHMPYSLGGVLDAAGLARLNTEMNRLLGQAVVSDEQVGAETSELYMDATEPANGGEENNAQLAAMEDGDAATAGMVNKSAFQVQFTETDSVISVLNALRDLLSSGRTLDGKLLMNFFGGREFAALLKDAFEQQWLIKPGELGEQNKISCLYEKTLKQLDKLEQIVRAGGQSATNLTELSGDIRNNIQFMNQINEAYTYVQIPLKLANQNASGELYVYTNKQSLQEQREELSAFLHLDMEHLGSTDVSVRLSGRKVDTKFYFQDDATYALVERFLPKLEAKLEAKGYQAHLSVDQEGHAVNFVEDFLMKDAKATGLVHRYSFDMRA